MHKAARGLITLANRLYCVSVYIRIKTKNVESVIAKTATAMTSPRCDGGLAKFDRWPSIGSIAGIIVEV
ncbi:MAG: hypothetical protein Q9212_005034 [Teloschistes hypoglaucus]